MTFELLIDLLLEDTRIGVYMCNHVYMFIYVHTFFVYGYAFTGIWKEDGES